MRAWPPLQAPRCAPYPSIPRSCPAELRHRPSQMHHKGQQRVAVGRNEQREDEKLPAKALVFVASPLQASPHE